MTVPEPQPRAELFDDWTQACRWLIQKEFSVTPLGGNRGQDPAASHG